jgi:O-acetyl-ADP-ribose deacetylase (regulator of RNase III)
MDFEVVQGDIAVQPADVLVNAAGTTLQMGSGVDGALKRGASEESNEAAITNGPIDLGAVAVTDALDLEADWVIHAAAMSHYGDGQVTEASIREATRNTLERADELGAASLVMPVLGTGVTGFETTEGGQISCDVIADYDPESLSDVRSIAYSGEAYGEITAVADESRTRT